MAEDELANSARWKSMHCESLLSVTTGNAAQESSNTGNAAQESNITGQSSIPVTHDMFKDLLHSPSSPIQVTTTHHNITATSLNNGMLGAHHKITASSFKGFVGAMLLSKSMEDTKVGSAANAKGSRLVTPPSPPSPPKLPDLRLEFNPKTQDCKGEGRMHATIDLSHGGRAFCVQGKITDKMPTIIAMVKKNH
jgi:hypothetical protein